MPLSAMIAPAGRRPARLQNREVLLQVAVYAGVPAAAGQSLGEALISGGMTQTLADAGISAQQVEAALDPAGYLGSAAVFTHASVAAHHALLDGKGCQPQAD